MNVRLKTTRRDSQPRPLSLVEQITAQIRDGIADGQWLRHLPGERGLARELGVSRRSLRQALEVLEESGLLRCEARARRRIVKGHKRKLPFDLPPTVGVLFPPALDRVSESRKPYMVEVLRQRVHKLGLSVRVHASAAWLSPRPQQRLEALIHESPARCWVLFAMPQLVQRWFDRRHLPAVISGQRFDGVRLPALATNYRAVARHAVEVLRRLGHRRIGLVMPTPQFGGDFATQAGFRDAIQPDVGVDLDRYEYWDDGSAQSIANRADEIVTQAPRPSALLVARTVGCVALLMRLLHQGVRVPEDISLISRDDDPHISHIVPEVARYTRNPQDQVRRLCSIVEKTVMGGTGPNRQSYIWPKLARGQTLAAPPPDPESGPK